MKYLISIPLLLFCILLFTCVKGQAPFYYKIHKVQGEILSVKGDTIQIAFQSRRKLIVRNCNDPQLELFLRTLQLAKHGRKELEHLISTQAIVTVHISDKVGMVRADGKFRLIAGITGPDTSAVYTLVDDYDGGLVYEQNTITLFPKSIEYLLSDSIQLSTDRTFLYDLNQNIQIIDFDLDTISLENIQSPDMLYRNLRELFYFAGIHEIHHTRSQNIELSFSDTQSYNVEEDAYLKELKAFKKRRQINRRKIKR